MANYPIEFGLSKPEARALLAHASKDETRPHLSSVLFDGAKGAIVATDGHRLAKLERAGEGRFILAREALARAVKACPAKASLFFELEGSNRVVIGAAYEKGGIARLFEVEPLDVMYPDYETVIPQKPAEPSACGLQGRYLADLGLVAKALESPWGAIECYGAAGPLDPALFRAESWTIVIMPCRVDGIEVPKPTRRAA